MNTSNHNSDSADLQWQAFRYVAGELSVAEADQFEQLLADDLAACEAVANVTELSLSARTVLEDQSSSLIRTRPEQPSRAGRWVATVAAFAALALLFAILLLPEQAGSKLDPEKSISDRIQDRSQSEAILTHWMTPILDGAEDSNDEFEPLAEEAVLVSYELTGETAHIPDWMYDAVLLEPGEQGEEIMDESGSPVQEF